MNNHNLNFNKDYFLTSQQIYSHPNNSFHIYDPLINNINTYKEQSLVLTTSNESMNRNISPPYDSQINWVQPISRRRRQRTVFTQNTIQQLDNVFIYNQYPDIELRENLAAQLGVSESRIQVWFKNRRTRARIAQRQQFQILET